MEIAMANSHKEMFLKAIGQLLDNAKRIKERLRNAQRSSDSLWILKGYWKAAWKCPNKTDTPLGKSSYWLGMM
jgi:hypothetical protein